MDTLKEVEIGKDRMERKYATDNLKSAMDTMFTDGSSIAGNRISEVGDMLKNFSHNSEEEDKDTNINLRKDKRTVERREKN